MSTGESKTEPAKPMPILGSYRLLQQLGTGGMSSVFRAVHVSSNAEVAVKILPRRLAQNPTLLQRFLNEAKNAERLQHPNIVAIYDRGFAEGRHYLVLEYVAGGDLQDRVRNEGPLPIGEAVRVVREVAEGLRYAAQRGVIHRDIKPANLLVSPQGHVKIIDLGLAVESEAEDERVTRDGTTVGTVDYMSPEQARNSRATSEASDIYSLGCTFFYLLTGAPPYAGGDVIEKLGRHCTAPIPDVRTKRKDVPEPLALLVKRMMAKKPIQRFATHSELLANLNALPIGLAPVEAESVPLMALIVEDDDAPLPVEPEPKRPTSGSTAARKDPKPEAAIVLPSLSDLVGLEDEPPPIARPRRATPTPPMAQFYDDIYDTPAPPVSRYRPGLFEQTTSLKTFIGIGVAIGLAIALVGFGLIQLYLALTEEAINDPSNNIITPRGKENPDPPEGFSLRRPPHVRVVSAGAVRPERGGHATAMALDLRAAPE